MIQPQSYRCLACGDGLDPENYDDPQDADFCGYCVHARSQEVEAREVFRLLNSPAALRREIVTYALVELYRDVAEKNGDAAVVTALNKVLRFMEA